jgi:DNA-binding transcriptional LysR family regulator
MQLGSPEALKQGVLAGLGLAWLPRLSVVCELRTDELRALRVAGLVISRTLSMIRRHDADLAPLAASFLDLVRST